jgi:AmiR/NasT family two-component response regulator
LERHVDDLEARLEARKLIDRAKGRLMSEHDYDEQRAWRFIQTRAMNERVKIADVARRVVDGELTP